MKETDSWKTFERTGAVKDYLQYKSSIDTTAGAQLERSSVRDAADLKNREPDHGSTV